MKILIKFPTRGRVSQFFNTLDLYYKMCDNINNLSFLISIDEDDKLMNNNTILNKLDKYSNLRYIIGNSLSKIDAVNRDVNLVDSWDILLLASDDMVPIVKGYDTIIINEMKNNYPDTDGILFFNDGYQKDKLNTLCILGKKYYDRFGYIYYPEYKSVWCDNEFMDIGYLLNKQTYFDNVIIRHEHPDWGYGSNDIIHHKNLINGDHDKNLYYDRKNNNFYL